MKINLLLLFFVAVAVALIPARDARATVSTWSEANANCEAHVAWIIANVHGAGYTVTGCKSEAPTWKDFAMTNTRGGLSSCGIFGEPASLGDCSYSGAYPPTCTQGKIDAGVAVANVSTWADGTSCDGGCMTGQFLGGQMNGAYYYTGAYCPYDSSTNPPDAPPPSSATAEPPSCNADGSCVSCSGSLCAETGLPPPPAPPAPASGSTSGNHSTTYNNTTNNSYSSSTSFSGGAASGTSSGGTSGGMDGTTATTTGTGTTNSQGKCDSGACDVGEADGQLGGLYAHSSVTPQGMFTQFIGEVKASPVISATTGFFEVQASGSCPSWHIPGNKYWGEAGFDFSFFCDPAFLAIFQLAGYLVLAGGAFCAFRIALY